MPSRTFQFGTANQLLAPPDGVYDNLGAHSLMAWIRPISLPPEDGSFYSILFKTFLAGMVQDETGPLLTIFTLNGILQIWADRTGATTNAASFSNISAGSFSINQWHHVAAVYDSGTRKYTLYLDGHETPYASQDALSGTVFDDSAEGWQIGNGDGVFVDAGFDGQIADVRIYDFILNAADILTIQSGGTFSGGDPVAWWKICGNSPELDSINNLNAIVTGSKISILNPPVPVCPFSGSSLIPMQVFSGDGSNNFTVIDNHYVSETSENPGDVVGAPGYDDKLGAVAQGENVYATGNIPDAVETAAIIIQDEDKGIFIRFKNPA